jgi:hypothetical protein
MILTSPLLMPVSGRFPLMYTLFALLTRLRYWNSEMPQLRSTRVNPTPALQRSDAKRA